jgi:mannosyltransferase OCH1-like enzyme
LICCASSPAAPFRTFDPKVYDIYSSFPIGVMKADFFRYAVLLAHGGVYADVDTACQVGWEAGLTKLTAWINRGVKAGYTLTWILPAR